MLNIFKSKKTAADKKPKQSTSLYGRFKTGLMRTHRQLGEGVANLLLGKKQIDEALLEEIETQLLAADVGVSVAEQVTQRLTDQVSRKQLADGDAVYAALNQHMCDLLAPIDQPLTIHDTAKPFVILVVGVNGVGKTTTIGKLAKLLQTEGKSVLLAAGDTFRAAAIEQLQIWGERNDVPVIAQHSGADSASVIFDAIQAAQARQIDVVIADTAGRLHTKQNLMEELKKIKRVMAKLDEHAPHEILLVLDASIGQNAIQQAEQFHQAVGVTGLAITKLDGTAKGGVLLALADKFAIPIRFVGIGEQVDDLKPFASEAFVNAIFYDQI